MPTTDRLARVPGVRGAQVWTSYEQAPYNYGQLWQVAQQVAPRDDGVPCGRLQWLRALSPQQAAIWRQVLQGYDDPQSADMQVRQAFLADALPAIDAQLAGYFGCDYLPLFVRFYRNRPGDELPVSARWHCDAGPRKHLKLLLYLSEQSSHDGGTAFLDYDTTMRLDEIGYLFCGLDRRLPDDELSALCQAAGIPWAPQSRSLAAGEGVLFEPSCILHRAQWPTVGERIMAQILFLPSPLPWREACAQWQMPRASQAWERFSFEEAPA